MTIASVKPHLLDAPVPAGGTRASLPAGDFAAVARSVAAGDLEGARAALGASGAGMPIANTLAQSLAGGNLAAARLALAQLGTDAFVPRDVAPGRPSEGLPFVTPPSASIPGAPGGTIPGTDTKVASPGPVAAPPALPPGLCVMDVGAGLPAGEVLLSGGGKVTSSGGGSYSVADVMLALATGNAGSIPADVINLYGPGGALYDPAAIMDAYRDSDIGKAQMAALSWIGKPMA
jgi:hypothetical protein